MLEIVCMEGLNSMVTKPWVQNSKELGHCLFHRFFLTQVYFIWSKFTLKLWEGAWGLTSSGPMFLDSISSCT